MDKGTARAVGLALALFFFKSVPVQLKTIMGLADRFTNYIYEGNWPKEAVEQSGKATEEGEGFLPWLRSQGEDPQEEDSQG